MEEEASILPLILCCVFSFISSISSVSAFGIMMKSVLTRKIKEIQKKPQYNLSSLVGTDNEPGVEWASPHYGTEKNPHKSTCPEGSYVNGAIMFSGQGTHTNALQFICYNPKTQKASKLFPFPTCGKRDRPDAKAIGMLLITPLIAIASIAASIVTFGTASPVAIAMLSVSVSLTVIEVAVSYAIESKAIKEAAKTVLEPSKGRKLWDHEVFETPGGLIQWEVIPHADEIHGIRLHGIRGEKSYFAGGYGVTTTKSKVGAGKKNLGKGAKKGRCPVGKVVTGVKASCGDRVDGIQFFCNTPPGFQK